MKLQEVQISKIKITENHRLNIEKMNLDELMQSIKQRGLLQPIGLAIKGKGYILRFGQRRLISCKKLGYKTISAMVTGKITDEKLLIENLTENMQRTDPSFNELGRIIKKLEDDGLSLKEIAVRIGFPLLKINQIVKVYNLLPEKYRKKVSFLSSGRGRKKGVIPANVATQIVAMKQHHGLKDKAIDAILHDVSEKGLEGPDLSNVGDLISSGMSAEKALENVREYGVFALTIVVKHTEVSELMQKHGLINRKHLFKKIFYGELPPLIKPDFISSGIVIKKEPEKKKEGESEQSSILKIRVKLMSLIREGKLSDTQKDALKPTASVSVKKWSEEQRAQIKDIYERVTR